MESMINWREVSQKYPKAFDELIKFIYKEKYSNYKKENHFIGAVFEYLEKRFPLRDCFDFFDANEINICPISNTDNKFLVEIWIQNPKCCITDYGNQLFKKRNEAEIAGFIFSITFLEAKLSENL